MKNYKLILILLIVSCRPQTNKDYITIPVDNTESSKAMVEDYFDDYDIIKLETNANCVISKIDRLYLYEDKIFILDKKSNCVFIFKNNGNYITKVKSIGKGPHEYIQLSDFTIDEHEKKLILLSNIPTKFLYFDLEGNFLYEESIKDVGENIGFDNNYISVAAINQSTNNYISIYKLGDNKPVNTDIRLSSNAKKYPHMRTIYPMLIKSSELFFFAPLDNFIYNLNNSEFRIKYYIDFGKNNLPEELNFKEDNFYQSCINNNYGFYISNFRENENFLVFKVEPNKLVFYNKSKGETKVHSSIRDSQTGFGITNYFAHDGKEDCFINIIEPFHMKFIAKKIKENNMYEELVDTRIFDLSLSTGKTDNPVLIKYAFKK